MNKVYVYDLRFTQAQKEYLKTLGFTHFYGERDREGTHYSIEPSVMVNHIGDIATNFEIDLGEDNILLDNEFVEKYKPDYVGLTKEQYQELEARR